MTEWYTHFDPSQFGKVPEAQENLLRPGPETRPDRADARTSGRPNLTLVKMQDKAEEQNRQRA